MNHRNRTNDDFYCFGDELRVVVNLLISAMSKTFDATNLPKVTPARHDSQKAPSTASSAKKQGACRTNSVSSVSSTHQPTMSNPLAEPRSIACASQKTFPEHAR